jgi:hypothetical protein
MGMLGIWWILKNAGPVGLCRPTWDVVLSGLYHDSAKLEPYLGRTSICGRNDYLWHGSLYYYYFLNWHALIVLGLSGGLFVLILIALACFIPLEQAARLG